MMSQLAALVFAPVGFTPTAAAPASTLPVYVVVGMARRAFGLGSLLSNHYSKTLVPIESGRNQPKMIWIHTGAIAAQVIKFHPFWNRVNEVLIGESVCTHRDVVDHDAPVACIIQSTCPEPAARFNRLNLGEKTFQRRFPDHA